MQSFACMWEPPEENEDPKGRLAQVLIYQIEQRLAIVQK